MHTIQYTCRGCGEQLPEAFLDLGLSPLANDYRRPDDPEETPRFRLAVAYCPGCHLVQLTDTVAPDRLFSEYLYFSSYSDSYVAHARDMADEVSRRLALDETSQVVEVASNDGYLLQFFQKRGIPVLGIEPAANIARHAAAKGIPTLNRFFGPDAVNEILTDFGPADVLIGNNVLAHVPSINDFLAAVQSCVKPGGYAVFEFPYLADLLDHGEFDTIYHEHIFYYSLTAIRNLAARAGLALADVDHQPVHGGSLRLWLRNEKTQQPSQAALAMLAAEEAAGITGPERYRRFAEDVRRIRDQFTGLLHRLTADGNTVAAYGAPAKGNTLLNYCGIDSTIIKFTVDRSPHKQGCLLPGSGIPILAPDELLKRMPDYAIILPWNISAEIVAQQAAYVHRGGRFIVPIPEPSVLQPALAAATC